MLSPASFCFINTTSWVKGFRSELLAWHLKDTFPPGSWAWRVLSKLSLTAALWAAPWCSMPQLLRATCSRDKILLALGQQRFLYFQPKSPLFQSIPAVPQFPATHLRAESSSCPAASSWLLGLLWMARHENSIMGRSENWYPYFIVAMGILCLGSW